MKLIIRNGGCNNTPGCRTPSKHNGEIICKKALPQQKMTSEQFSINLTVPWKCSDTPDTGIFLDCRDRENKTATLQKNLQIFPVLTLTKTNSSRKESPPAVAALCCSRGTSSLSSRIPALAGPAWHHMCPGK